MSADEAVVRLDGGTLRVSGKVGPHTVVALRKEGEALLEGQRDGVTVDLSGLDTAHSVVLSLLLCWQRMAASRNQSVQFAGASARLQSLAALSGLDAQLPGLDSAPSYKPTKTEPDQQGRS